MCTNCPSDTAPAPDAGTAEKSAVPETPTPQFDYPPIGSAERAALDSWQQDAEPEIEMDTCDLCGVQEPSDDCTMTYYEAPRGAGLRLNGYYCQSCADAYLVACCACDVPLHQRHSTAADNGHHYCETCYSETYTSCDGCGCELYRDDASCNDDGVYCSPCYDEQSANVYDSSEDVLDHVGMLDSPKDGLRFGMEIEIETRDMQECANYLSDRMSDYAILKEDGSLRGGFEIVTAPGSLAAHRERIAEFFPEGMGHRDWRSSYSVKASKSPRCGLHVHISRKPLTPLQIGKMQVFLHNPVNADFVYAIARRDPSEWASCSDAKRLTDARKGNSAGRYTALNLENRHTVELRIFRSSVAARTILASLEFAEALVRYCAAGEVSIADSADAAKFTRWLEKRAKQYPALVAFCRTHNLMPTPANPRLGDPVQSNLNLGE